MASSSCTVRIAMTTVPSTSPALSTSNAQPWAAPLMICSIIGCSALIIGVTVLVITRMCQRKAPKVPAKVGSSVAPAESVAVAQPADLQIARQQSHHHPVFDPEYLQSVAEEASSGTPRSPADTAITQFTSASLTDAPPHLRLSSSRGDNQTRTATDLAGIRTRKRRPSLIKAYIISGDLDPSGPVMEDEPVMTTAVEPVQHNDTFQEISRMESGNMYQQRRAACLKLAAESGGVGGSRRLAQLAEIRTMVRLRSLEQPGPSVDMPSRRLGQTV